MNDVTWILLNFMNVRYNAMEKTTEFWTHRMKDAEFDTIRYVLLVTYYTMVQVEFMYEYKKLNCNAGKLIVNDIQPDWLEYNQKNRKQIECCVERVGEV